MLAGALDRVLPGRRSYLHRVNVERRPRPPSQSRPHSYHGGATAAESQRRDGLRTSGRKLAAKFWSSAAAAVVAGRSAVPEPAAVRKRTPATAAATTTCSNGGFSNVSHTWRFKRLRFVRWRTMTRDPSVNFFNITLLLLFKLRFCRFVFVGIIIWYYYTYILCPIPQ